MAGYVNYQLRYKTKGRFIFVPTEDCRLYGERLLVECQAKVPLPAYHFHYASGGHVAALHRHIENKFFFRIDNPWLPSNRTSLFAAMRRWRLFEAIFPAINRRSVCSPTYRA